MRVRVEMKDGTKLNTFATISFYVCEYVITLYSYVGDINQRLTTNGYFYDIQYVPLDITMAMIGRTIGHATWQIEESGSTTLATTAKWTKYVNVPCGYSVSSGGKNTFIANLRIYPASRLAINAPGDLIKNDKTGGTNKQFKMTKIQAEKALDKTLNIDTTKADYILHSNNCVDNALAVAKEGGTVFTSSCKRSVTISDGTYSNTEPIALPSELEVELKNREVFSCLSFSVVINFESSLTTV
ncbi:MAG: hypothetical protein LBC74_09540 [Planctomycetaceae bacterium]|jgi:hypothetical protein|nr:hypothetical protein [Planctomycetaceae bacterium]